MILGSLVRDHQRHQPAHAHFIHMMSDTASQTVEHTFCHLCSNNLAKRHRRFAQSGFRRSGLCLRSTVQLCKTSEPRCPLTLRTHRMDSKEEDVCTPAPSAVPKAELRTLKPLDPNTAVSMLA